MWQRIKRVFKSFANFFVSVAEDPELILEQNVRDLNAQVPQMNESIAMVRANLTLLEKEQQRQETERVELESRIKAAIQADRDDIAASYAVQLEHVRRNLSRNGGQLEAARTAYDKALNLKRIFMREKEKKSREALDAIRAHKRAQWQVKVAQAIEGLEVGGLDATHDEMIRKIEQRTALDEARMELALEGLEGTQARIEEDAERIRAEELVRQYKEEMALEEGETPRALEEGAPRRRVEVVDSEASEDEKVGVK